MRPGPVRPPFRPPFRPPVRRSETFGKAGAPGMPCVG